MHDTTALKSGTYAVRNGHTFTSQVWEVTAEQVRVSAAAAGNYPAAFLRTMTHAEAAEILSRPCSAVLEFTPAPVPTIGKQAARTLHLDLARLGFRDHYAAAGDALGRSVPSLAELTAAESATVYSYARGVWGMA